MRHHIVTRIVAALVVLWTVAVVVFAWAVRRPGDPGPVSVPRETATGDALFERHCAMCHRAAGTGASYREMADRAAAAAALSGFLVDHYGPGPEGNTRIAEYLLDIGPR